MRRDDIIELAREAGLDPDLWNFTDAFERFAQLVAEHERYECLKICEKQADSNYWEGADVCADAIRARGQQSEGEQHEF